jgi:hypothetical protein
VIDLGCITTQHAIFSSSGRSRSFLYGSRRNNGIDFECASAARLIRCSGRGCDILKAVLSDGEAPMLGQVVATKISAAPASVNKVDTGRVKDRFGSRQDWRICFRVRTAR